MSDKIVNTPFGKFPAEHVHEHPTGSTVHHDETQEIVRVTLPDGSTKHYEPNPDFIPPEPQPPITINDGWFNYTGWYPPQNVGKFTATYIVPNTPTNIGNQILYYFIGVQDNSSSPLTILQPVLAFQGWATGWNLASWNCCPQGQVHHTNFITGLQPGDTVTASIEKTGPQEYTIDGTWQGQTASLRINTGAELFNWADVTLEVYNISSCDQFAVGPMKFLDLSLTGVDGTPLVPSWTLYPSGGATSCDGGLTITGNMIVIEQNKSS